MAKRKNDYDAIIIGAGISGLVCGCYLAKAGIKTLIVEKNHQAGGYCTSFRRNGFLFDACAHGLSSFRKNGRMYKFAKELNFLKDLKLERLNPSDVIITPEHKIRIFNELSETIKSFQLNFPKEKKNIKILFDAIALSPISSLMKLRNKTFKDILDESLVDERLKTILSVFILGIVGVSPERVSSIVAILAIREFLFDGGYYPVGGMQELPNILVAKFKKMGGEIKLLTTVKEIQVVNKKAVGILLNTGISFYAKNIISAVDARQTFFKLLKRKWVEKIFRENIIRKRTSFSAFIIYLGVKTSSSIPSILKSNIWVINDFNLDALLRGVDIQKNNYFALTSSSIKGGMKRLAENNSYSLSIAVNAKYSGGTFWKEENKQKLTDRLIDLAEKEIPNLSKHIIFKEVASPITLYKWTYNYKGAAYGWESNREQFGDISLTQRTAIENLFITGHWSNQSSGITLVANCGYNTAELIKRKESKTI